MIKDHDYHRAIKAAIGLLICICLLAVVASLTGCKTGGIGEDCNRDGTCHGKLVCKAQAINLWTGARTYVCAPPEDKP